MSGRRILFICYMALGLTFGTVAGYLVGDLSSFSAVADTGFGIAACMLLSVVVGGVAAMTVCFLEAIVKHVASRAFQFVALVVGVLLISSGAGFLIGALGTATVSRPGVVGPLWICGGFGCYLGSTLGHRVASHVRKRRW